jgi:hypothetical protein
MINYTKCTVHILRFYMKFHYLQASVIMAVK